VTLRLVAHRYGARLFCWSPDATTLAISRPPVTDEAAFAAAWEYTAYNEGFGNVYMAYSITSLTAGLKGADAWFCWWD
jgi:uncharacterized protein DUF4253